MKRDRLTPDDGEFSCGREQRLLVLPPLVVLGVSLHYERSSGNACASCHEIWQPFTDWRTSSHRNVKCGDCHGDVFTLRAGFHINNMRRVVTHLRGRAPEQPRLRTQDVLEMVARCEKCHQQDLRTGDQADIAPVMSGFF